MITIFNRREVRSTYSMAEQAAIRSKLSHAGIKYVLKVSNLQTRNYGIGGTTRGRFGSAGVNLDFSYEYTFYVHKKDFDEAAFIISH